MKRLVLVLLATTASLWADGGDAFIERLYAKMAASFAADQGLGRGGDVLLLANPGFPITDAYLQDTFELSQLADQTPLPARFYLPSGAFCSTTYRTILTQAEATNYQNMASRFAALKARRVIYDRKRPGKPTPTYAAYLKYQAAYLSALDALNLARAEQRATGRAVPFALAQAVDAARRDWESLGFRQLIEDAQRSLTAFYDENVKALFGNLLAEFSSSARTDGHGGPWYPVIATPPPEEWLLDKDWKPFRLAPEEKSLAGSGASLPLEAKPTPHPPGNGLSSVSITADTKRVSLSRPWLDSAIFHSHGWRFLRGSGFTRVSTGNPGDPDPGIMPLLVTGVLLSRNLVVKGQWNGDRVDDLKALGPFALASPPGAAPSLRPRAARGDGRLTLAVDGPQIIGFICTPVPKSPDPDAKAFRSP